MFEEEIIIKDADIVLAGVALSNIYINKDHLLTIGKDISSSNKSIKALLNSKTKEFLGIQEEIWSTEIKNIEQFNSLSKSHSAYIPISKREYLAICQLEDVYFNDDVIKKDQLGVLGKYNQAVRKICKNQEFKIEDIELRFYEYGNVTITGRFKIRDMRISPDEYQILSEFAHAFFGPALKATVSKLVNIYIKVMEEIDANKEVDIQMLNIPLDMDLSMNELELNGSLKYTLDFAIRYHFIYNSSLRKKESFVDPFVNVLSGEWEMNLKNTIQLGNASIYFGWTHSLIILDDYDAVLSPRYYETYRFPLEVVLTNWGALNSLLKRVEKARAIFFEEIEEVEKSSFKHKNYTKIACDMREFTLKVERIMHSFDSYTVSNNPMHYKLIEMQQDVFLEHKSIGRIKNQIDLVGQIINELSIREKNYSDSRLSKVVLMLTGLTIIDISKTVFDVASSGTITQIPFLCILSGMLIILVIGYKADFRKAKNPRK